LIEYAAPLDRPTLSPLRGMCWQDDLHRARLCKILHQLRITPGECSVPRYLLRPRHKNNARQVQPGWDAQ